MLNISLFNYDFTTISIELLSKYAYRSPSKMILFRQDQQSRFSVKIILKLSLKEIALSNPSPRPKRPAKVMYLHHITYTRQLLRRQKSREDRYKHFQHKHKRSFRIVIPAMLRNSLFPVPTKTSNDYPPMSILFSTI